MSIILDCIKTVGRGERGRKPLTMEQAYAVMDAYLASKEQNLQEGDPNFIGDDQMAMLLMLIRVQNETNQEIAGFVKAFQSRMPSVGADIDWPCYAGKRSSENGSDHPWHGLAAKILSTNGYKVLLHGYKDAASGRTHVEDYLAQLDIPVADNASHAETLLNQHNIAYLPLANFFSTAQTMIGWKDRYGLRTPMNTVVRALNPGGAKFAIRGSFHPGFQQLHAEIDQLIDSTSLSVVSFKGQNGEAEYNPKVSQTVWFSDESGVESFYWPEKIDDKIAQPSSCPFTGEQDSHWQERQIQMANSIVTSMASVLFAKYKDVGQAYQTATAFWESYCQSK